MGHIKGFALKDGDVLIEQNRIQMVSGNELLRQTVESVLQTNKKEWFLNWQEGINIYNLLGKRKSDEIIENEILQGLLQVDSSFIIEDFSIIEEEGRNMKIYFTARTSSGESITVSNMDAGVSRSRTGTMGYYYNSSRSNSVDVSNKANKATTLAGYGITDAYTQEQTDTAISAALANAPYLTRMTVEKLPDVSVASANVIYVIYTDAESDDNKYTEYMLINGAWEKTGGSDIVDITTDEIDSLYGEV